MKPSQESSLSQEIQEANGSEKRDEEEMEGDSMPQEVEEIPSTHSRIRSERVTPSVALKQGLREERMERMRQETGRVSYGRKLWTEEESEVLLRVWKEENVRVWASAGKKTFSLSRIVQALQVEGVERDLSQVEGKIKGLRRDYRSVKGGTASPAVQQKVALILDKLDDIFSTDNQSE